MQRLNCCICLFISFSCLDFSPAIARVRNWQLAILGFTEFHFGGVKVRQCGRLLLSLRLGSMPRSFLAIVIIIQGANSHSKSWLSTYTNLYNETTEGAAHDCPMCIPQIPKCSICVVIGFNRFPSCRAESNDGSAWHTLHYRSWPLDYCISHLQIQIPHDWT